MRGSRRRLVVLSGNELAGPCARSQSARRCVRSSRWRTVAIDGEHSRDATRRVITLLSKNPTSTIGGRDDRHGRDSLAISVGSGGDSVAPDARTCNASASTTTRAAALGLRRRVVATGPDHDSDVADSRSNSRPSRRARSTTSEKALRSLLSAWRLRVGRGAPGAGSHG